MNPSANMTVLLRVSDLHTTFTTSRGPIRAVDGVSFALDEGGALGLVGESGCGKSVTALSLMRLIPARSALVQGRVEFDGADLLSLTESEMRRFRGNRLAMIFQDPMTSLNPVLTVGRQLTESLELHLRMDPRQSRRRALELLDQVGIPAPEARIRDYPHQFSGGMRQRVMIAMAISCNPKLIIADEITTALDVTIQAQVLELLKNLTRDLGTAFILITHDLGVIAGMTQRVNIMYGGRIVESADTREIFARPRMPYTSGLLKSMPRLDKKRVQRLVPIEGMPPDLLSPPTGCRFEPRCAYRRPICAEKEPELLPSHAVPTHFARCWATQEVPGGGWLVGTDWHREAEDIEANRAVSGSSRFRVAEHDSGVTNA